MLPAQEAEAAPQLGHINQNHIKMKKISTIIAAAARAVRRIGRNTVAVFLRLALAFRHQDFDEIARAILRIVFEGTWLLCLFLVAMSLGAGFVKPHCFVMSIAFVVVAGICRKTADDIYESWRA